jgi:hypothetical protein
MAETTCSERLDWSSSLLRSSKGIHTAEFMSTRRAKADAVIDHGPSRSGQGHDRMPRRENTEVLTAAPTADRLMVLMRSELTRCLEAVGTDPVAAAPALQAVFTSQVCPAGVSVRAACIVNLLRWVGGCTLNLTS